MEPTVWTFGIRRLTVRGQQGLVEYAEDQNGTLWYRFINDAPDKYESWKLVAH